MISVLDRRKIVELINKTRNAGARLASACKVAGITSRTYQRWIQCDHVKEDGRPLAKHPEPVITLSQQEKDLFLEICKNPKMQAYRQAKLCLVSRVGDSTLPRNPLFTRL